MSLADIKMGDHAIREREIENERERERESESRENIHV